jgi:hypothetical protein
MVANGCHRRGERHAFSSPTHPGIQNERITPEPTPCASIATGSLPVGSTARYDPVAPAVQVRPFLPPGWITEKEKKRKEKESREE